MISSPKRTFELIERKPVTCALTQEDVQYLLLHHRKQVRLSATGEAALYRLISLGYVGAIRCPNTWLILRPKIPLVDLFHLLQPNCKPEEESLLLEANPGMEALNFLAAELVRLVRARLAHGLQRGYLEREAVSSSVRGRLDVAAQLRQARSRRDQVFCRFDDFTVDIPCNQVVRTAIDLLLRSSWLAASLRAMLGELLLELAEVSTLNWDERTIQKLVRDGQASSYGPLLDICELLLLGLHPELAQGMKALPGFLLSMDRIFERYVCLGLQMLLPRRDLRLQPTYVIADNLSWPDWQLRPDLSYHRLGAIITLLDTKWKHLGEDRLPTDDLYQMATYCTATGCKRGILVYPGSKNRRWSYPLGCSDVTIEVCSLRVTGGAEACRKALGTLAGRLISRALTPKKKDEIE